MVITVASQKGSQAKTQTTINLAAAFAATGKRGLVIDLDSQQHGALRYRSSIEGVAWADALPADVAGFDFVLIDTPPLIVPELGAAFLRSDLVLIPCTPHGASLESLARTFETIELTRAKNENLVAAVTFSCVDRSQYAAGVIAAARVLSMWGVTQTAVPLRVIDFEKAFSACRPVVCNAPKSAAAAAYRELSREIEAILGK